MVVGAGKGDVERTREANNPNFIVGDLHSESHYQTTVPHARYNYAGVVAQQKCIEFSLSLSLPSSSLCFASPYLSAFPFLRILFSPTVLLFLFSFLFSRSLFTRVSRESFAPTCKYTYLFLSALARFAFFSTFTDYAICDNYLILHTIIYYVFFD